MLRMSRNNNGSSGQQEAARGGGLRQRWRLNIGTARTRTAAAERRRRRGRRSHLAFLSHETEIDAGKALLTTRTTLARGGYC